MTKRVSRIAAICLWALAFHAFAPSSASAQQPLPRPLPWGITGAEASVMLRDSADFRIAAHRAGREIYATSHTGLMQAVAVLARDTLVGIIYFQPAGHAASAQSLFSDVSVAAEREYGPPFCRGSGVAVWEMENGLLEVRLKRPSGDGHPGAEIRFSGPGFAEEMARRAASASRPTPRPASTQPAPRGSSGPRLLGTAVDSVAPSPIAASPIAESSVAPEESPVDAESPSDALAARCG